MLSKIVGFHLKRDSLNVGKHHPASNTAAVVTLTGAALTKYVIQSIQWSYDTAPTGGNLKIERGATTDWSVSITTAGPGGFSFILPGNTNENVVVTLAAGGAGVTGKLNIQYTTESTRSK